MSVCIPFYNVLPHMCGASAVSTIVQGKKDQKIVNAPIIRMLK